MRKLLKWLGSDARFVFVGVFVRLGHKTGWTGFPEATILLRDVRNNAGAVIADHLWFSYTKGFQSLGALQEGDTIEFAARVSPYVKGFVNSRDCVDERELDYKLSYPTKVRKVGEPCT